MWIFIPRMSASTRLSRWRRQQTAKSALFRCAPMACGLAIACSGANAAGAQGRYALESAVVHVDEAMPIAAKPRAATRSATSDGLHAYTLSGTVIAGADTIFADGFEPNRAWDVTFAEDVPIGTTLVELGSVAVPAGSYMALARLQVRTGSETNPGNSYRLDCSLSSFDYGVYRVGTESNVERYVTFQGAATLASPGTIALTCRDGNGHVDTALSGKLTVLSVSGID